MESRPQNPEFRNNPENFHPWNLPPTVSRCLYSTGMIVHLLL